MNPVRPIRVGLRPMHIAGFRVPAVVLCLQRRPPRRFLIAPLCGQLGPVVCRTWQPIVLGPPTGELLERAAAVRMPITPEQDAARRRVLRDAEWMLGPRAVPTPDGASWCGACGVLFDEHEAAGTTPTPLRVSVTSWAGRGGSGLDLYACEDYFRERYRSRASWGAVVELFPAQRVEAIRARRRSA